MTEERNRAHLLQIIELAEHLARRLDGVSRDQFVADRDEVDLTAYRLAAIGEATQKLTATLRDRHPQIPWQAIYGMRNIIAHEYGAVVPIRVWNVIGDQLDALETACRTELARTD